VAKGGSWAEVSEDDADREGIEPERLEKEPVVLSNQVKGKKLVARLIASLTEVNRPRRERVGRCGARIALREARSIPPNTVAALTPAVSRSGSGPT